MNGKLGCARMPTSAAWMVDTDKCHKATRSNPSNTDRPRKDSHNKGSFTAGHQPRISRKTARSSANLPPGQGIASLDRRNRRSHPSSSPRQQ